MPSLKNSPLMGKSLKLNWMALSKDLQEKTLGKLLSENIDTIDAFMASKRAVDLNGDGTKEE